MTKLHFRGLDTNSIIFTNNQGEFMLRVIALLGVALLSGCASMAPLTPESAGKLKSGKNVVAFYDVTQKINYIEDVYLVLGVAQVGSESAYNGIWDSNKDMSAVHAEELTKVGVHSVSAYDGSSDVDSAELTALQKEMYALSVSAEDKTLLQLKPRLRDMLLQKGFDHFFWLTWPGYTLHLQTLGLPAREMSNTQYWLFDLKQNKVLWNGTILTNERLSLDGKKGKEFLEKDNLSGLKTEVEKLARQRYKYRSGRGIYGASVGQKIGFEDKI